MVQKVKARAIALDVETVGKDKDEATSTLAIVNCATVYDGATKVLHTWVTDVDLGKGIDPGIDKYKGHDRTIDRSQELNPAISLCEYLDAVIQEGPIRIVTWNGRGFDLPVLWHSCIAERRQPPAIITKILTCKPWDALDMHVDLMRVAAFEGKGKFLRLGDTCVRYGLPNPKSEGDGGIERPIDKLIDYNCDDVLALVDISRLYGGLCPDVFRGER
jgi:hypothetical protein